MPVFISDSLIREKGRRLLRTIYPFKSVYYYHSVMDGSIVLKSEMDFERIVRMEKTEMLILTNYSRTTLKQEEISTVSMKRCLQLWRVWFVLNNANGCDPRSLEIARTKKWSNVLLFRPVATVIELKSFLFRWLAVLKICAALVHYLEYIGESIITQTPELVWVPDYLWLGSCISTLTLGKHRTKGCFCARQCVMSL